MNSRVKDHEEDIDHGFSPGLGRADDEVTPSAIDFRGGGTDLFRGVLVVLAAMAIGAFLVTRGLDGADSDDDVTDTAAETVDDIVSDTAADDTVDGAAADDATIGSSTADDSAIDDGTAGTAGTDDAMTDSSDPAAPATTDGATGTETTEAVDDATTTSLDDTATPRPPAEVAVIVLNATDQKGIAGKGTDLLKLSNYNTLAAGNVSDDNFGRGSVILYQEGYRADAVAVAEVFGDGLEVLVQPFDPASPPSDELDDAKVIVILGIDDAIPIA